MRKPIATCLIACGFCLMSACSPIDLTSSPTGTPEMAAQTITPALETQSPYPIDTPLSTQVISSYPFPSDHTPDTTEQAVISAKASLVAELTLTQATYPTNTPLPTLPVGAKLCYATELSGNGFSTGATAMINIAVSYTNTGNEVCVLNNPPAITLIDRQGKSIEVEYARQPIRGSDENQIGIGVGETRIVELTWTNWCRPSPEGGIWVKLTLPEELGGDVISPTDAVGGGRCEVPNSYSTVDVSLFRYLH